MDQLGILERAVWDAGILPLLHAQQWFCKVALLTALNTNSVLLHPSNRESGQAGCKAPKLSSAALTAATKWYSRQLSQIKIILSVGYSDIVADTLSPNYWSAQVRGGSQNLDIIRFTVLWTALLRACTFTCVH